MSVDRQALVGFIAEIEASRDRAKGESRHQSEIFKKAREKQLDPKAMRKVLQRRAMSKTDRESLDEAVDLYEHALGSLAKAKEAVEGGMSRREAAEKFNVPRAALGHLAGGSRNAISDPVAHDADGVILAAAPAISTDPPAINNDDAALPVAASAEADREQPIEDAPAVGIPTAAVVAPLPLAIPAEEVCTASVTPAPDGGVGTGTLCRECGEAWHGGDCAPVPDVKPRELTPVEIGAVASASERVATPDSDIWDTVGPPPVDRRRAA